MDQATWIQLLDLKENLTKSPQLKQSIDTTSLEVQEYLQVIKSREFSLNRPVIFAHLAQTLDARIACHNGDSKWIGNEGNLIHAHRMRAICDAVLVGKQTWDTDSPKLNVRHVKGKDPVKILIEGHSISGNTYQKTFVYNDGRDETGVWDNISELLELFYQRGVKTLFIEGGGKTVSYFLKNKLVDHLQLHISPLIIGSGINSLTLPQISRLDEAISFENARFIPIDDHIMFSGKVKYQ